MIALILLIMAAVFWYVCIAAKELIKEIENERETILESKSKQADRISNDSGKKQ